MCACNAIFYGGASGTIVEYAEAYDHDTQARECLEVSDRSEVQALKRRSIDFRWERPLEFKNRERRAYREVIFRSGLNQSPQTLAPEERSFQVWRAGI